MRAVATNNSHTMVGSSVNGQRSSSTDATTMSNTTASLPHLSATQWQTIATMFGNTRSSTDRLHGEFSKHSWIIDTGASNHVTGNKSCLFNVHDIGLCLVGLPDGQQIIATKEGSVKLLE